MGARGTSMPHNQNQVVDMTAGRNNFGLNVNAGKYTGLSVDYIRCRLGCQNEILH